MSDNPLTSLPPKYLAGIVIVGVGVGLYMRKRKASVTTTATDAANASPVADTTSTDSIDTALPTVGNLGSTAGGLVGVTTDGTNSASNLGAPSGITLPITQYVVTVDGQQYYSDANGKLTPVNPKPTPVALAAHTVKRGERFKSLVIAKYPNLTPTQEEAKIKELAQLNGLTLIASDPGVKPWASGQIIYI